MSWQSVRTFFALRALFLSALSTQHPPLKHTVHTRAASKQLLPRPLGVLPLLCLVRLFVSLNKRLPTLFLGCVTVIVKAVLYKHEEQETTMKHILWVGRVDQGNIPPSLGHRVCFLCVPSLPSLVTKLPFLMLSLWCADFLSNAESPFQQILGRKW